MFWIPVVLSLTSTVTVPYLEEGAFVPISFYLSPSFSSTSTDTWRIRIVLDQASFSAASNCYNFLEASGGFPAISACTFTSSQLTVTLQTAVTSGSTYRVTCNIYIASSSTYSVFIETVSSASVVTVIDSVTNQVLASTLTTGVADSGSYPYISDFTLSSQSSFTQGSSTDLVFLLSNYGTLDQNYYIDIFAFPQDVWDFGTPGVGCLNYVSNRWASGSACTFMSFSNPASTTTSNGFRIQINSGGPATNQSQQQFGLTVSTPSESVRMFWVAQSRRLTAVGGVTPTRVSVLDSAIYTIGNPLGRITSWTTEAISATQQVTLMIKPFTNIFASASLSGTMKVYLPSGFSVSTTPSSVTGYNSLPCTWTTDSSYTIYSCALSLIPVLSETSYYFSFEVINPSAASPPVSWTAYFIDSTGLEYLSASNKLGGFPVVTTMVASMQHENEIASSTNTITVTLEPNIDIARVTRSKIKVFAAESFSVGDRCQDVLGITNFPESFSCTTDGDRTLIISFSDTDIILADTVISFSFSVANPTSGAASENGWLFYTLGDDDTPINLGTVPSFDIYSASFSSILVSPTARVSGETTVTVVFTPGFLFTTGQSLEILAPSTYTWTTSSLTTTISSYSVLSVSLDSISTNSLLLSVTAGTSSTTASFAVTASLVVPAATPTVNNWWVHVYSGSTYIASSGIEGFYTEVLSLVSLTACDISKSSSNNPILFHFTPGTSIVTQVGSAAVLQVTAPTGFAFICSFSTDCFEYSGTALPSDTACSVSSNVLRLSFPTTGLVAGTSYYFAIAVTNPSSTPSSNSYSIVTYSGSSVVETATVSGFTLATYLGDAKYQYTSTESRLAGATSNTVVFSFTLSAALTSGTILEFEAPQGFALSFDDAGTCYVQGSSASLSITYTAFLSSSALSCSSPAGYPRKAQLTLLSSLSSGTYALNVKTSNPLTTPTFNYWKISVINSSGTTIYVNALMTGFRIQEILAVTLTPSNQGNRLSSESSANIINFTFTTTTALSTGKIVVYAPEGFYFPEVCQDFTSTASGSYSALPTTTSCAGEVSSRTLILTLSSSLASGSYTFEATVQNPLEPFFTGTGLYWNMMTKSAANVLVDAGYSIAGFPVYQRAKLFTLESLAQGAGVETTLIFTFSLFYNLLPQNSITITGPSGISFTSILGNACSDSSSSSIYDSYAASSSSVLSVLPSYMTCAVSSSSTLVLTNTEASRKGRPLLAGPIYMQALQYFTNPSITPTSNIWRIVAYTSANYAPEVWAASGFSILPVLQYGSVSSSNPGIGLTTNFTFSIEPTTDIPVEGSVRFASPVTDIQISNSSGTCAPFLTTSTTATCPFTFTACSGTSATDVSLCTSFNSRCQAGSFTDYDSTYPLIDPIVFCSVTSTYLQLKFGEQTSLASGARLIFSVSGYNSATNLALTDLWTFSSHSSDTSAATIDSMNVASFVTYGFVSVYSIVPSDSSVSVIGNIVTVTLTLTTDVAAPARLTITFPSQFSSSTSATVSSIDGFPSNVQTRISSNLIQIDSLSDPLPSDTSLVFSVSLSNPSILPSVNKWEFYTSSITTSAISNVNYYVEGFAIYGSFKNYEIAPQVKAPSSNTALYIWFSLNSDLPWESTSGTSYLILKAPVGYNVIDGDCGSSYFSTQYNAASDAEETLTSMTYYSIPQESYCTSVYDDSSEVTTLTIYIDGLLSLGVNYAFTVGIVNPAATPSNNFFTLYTTYDRVTLHYLTTLAGYSIRNLYYGSITPDSSLSEGTSSIVLSFESALAIPGGSVVTIQSPVGFTLYCTSISFSGLGSTTTCTLDSSITIKLTVDSSNSIVASTSCTVNFKAKNPVFTPSTNIWTLKIVSSADTVIDVKNDISGFDITGSLLCTLTAKFTAKSKANYVTIVANFATLISSLDESNRLAVLAPSGFVFSTDCEGFSAFEGVISISATCTGYGNNTAVIYFAEDETLLNSKTYKFILPVTNPASVPTSNYWVVKTLRYTGDAYEVLDLNSTVPGFTVTETATTAYSTSHCSWSKTISLGSFLLLLILNIN
jgi:hypothetical protein